MIASVIKGVLLGCCLGVIIDPDSSTNSTLQTPKQLHMELYNCNEKCVEYALKGCAILEERLVCWSPVARGHAGGLLDDDSMEILLDVQMEDNLYIIRKVFP